MRRPFCRERQARGHETGVGAPALAGRDAPPHLRGFLREPGPRERIARRQGRLVRSSRTPPGLRRRRERHARPGRRREDLRHRRRDLRRHARSLRDLPGARRLLNQPRLASAIISLDRPSSGR